MKQRQAIRERFKGKVAIVTGGSAGIGQATVEELCKEGSAVAFTGIEEDLGRKVADKLEQDGYEAIFCHGDMADEQFCKNVVKQTLDRWGKVHYLVNNAFSFVSRGLDATRADWERVFQVGPFAFATMAQNVAEPMKQGGGGAIVNVSSISAFIAQPGRWTYNSAKGAVETLTKCMALDLVAYGIRVNCVSPGWIWTRVVDEAAGWDRAKWEAVWGQFHMLERCGEPVEVAAAILFLLSDDAAFITAANLPVDGGYLGMGSEGLGKSSEFADSK
jgi:NAD(P)-dependent dehydrogenase (short-subunit alcohol dehydrogenase family)